MKLIEIKTGIVHRIIDYKELYDYCFQVFLSPILDAYAELDTYWKYETPFDWFKDLGLIDLKEFFYAIGYSLEDN